MINNDKGGYGMKTIKETAEIMQVSEVTIRRWITDNKIKVSQQYKNGVIRITDEEIDRLKRGEK